MMEYNSGCKKTAMSQKDFISAVNDGNSGLGKYLSGLYGAMGALRGFICSLIGARAATIGLQVATMALNAAMTMGISVLISWAVQAIDKLITTSDELAEKVDEVTSKYKQQHEELKKLKGDYDTENESSMISKYEKLSKGVGNLGENVSLTADEYSEYQSITNKIAEQFPKLIIGYDSQGNAILSCKDNIEKLTEAYEDLIHTQNREILTNAGNIEDNFKNAVKDLDSSGFLGMKMDTDAIKELEKIYANPQSDDLYDKFFEFQNDTRTWQIGNALKDAGVDVSFWDKTAFGKDNLKKKLKETMEKDPEIIKGIIEEHYGNLDEYVEEMKTISQATLSEAFDITGSEYYGMSDALQDVANSVINSFDDKFLIELQGKGKTVRQYTNEMLESLNSLSAKNTDKIETAFDLQTQFNGGEISYGEYIHSLEDVKTTIEGLGLDDRVEDQLKISLGLDENGVIEKYKQLRKRLADNEQFDIMPSEYEPFLEGLSSEELSVLIDIIPELSETDYKETISDVKAAIEKEMMLQGLTFDLNLEVEAAGIEALNTALAESVSATGLSSESITALKSRYADLELQGYNLSSMFEETSTGIRLNRQEFSKLENAYATDKLSEIDGELNEMKSAYDDLGEAIKNCDDPIKKSELFNDRQTLAKRISEAATLATQYKGLTSAYNDWLAAEEAGQERDMYENIIKGFETVDDEISRGWVDDGTIEFLELLTGRTDLAGKSGKQLKEVYDSLDKSIGNAGYSVRDFFTVNEDGESTNTGVYNFLETIESLGGKYKDTIKQDDNGNIIGFNFEVAGGDEAIAEALGVSEELVQIMVRAADDAGFVVSMDGTYRQLADLQNEAKAAADYLHQIGKTDFEFDFNTSSVENLKTQLEEAHKILDDKKFWNKDGTFNFNADGATQAMQVVSTLQAKLDKLTEEQYGIGLTVEDEEFEEPLENLQEYGRTVQTLNQLKLNPKANAEEIKELEGDLKEISEYFANLDGETKVELGFEADDGIEEVKKKIESGEVKIPTVLDIQANMDKNIERLADLAWLNSGFLTEDEEKVIKKKYNIKVEADDVDTSDVDGKVDGVLKGAADGAANGAVKIEVKPEIEVKTPTEKLDSLLDDLEGYSDAEIEIITKFIADPSDVENYKPEQKETIIKFIADTLEVDGYTPEEKKAYAKYLVDGGNLDDYTPEEKEAIVRYLIEGEAIDSYSPEEKQAIVKFLKNSGEVDNYTPAEKQAIAKFIKNSVEPDGYQPPNKEAIATYYKDSSAVDNYQPANKEAKVTFWATIKKVGSSLWGFLTGGGGGKKRVFVNGTANVNGTALADGTTGRAYKQGNWGVKKTETALTGELGQELVVYKNHWYTVGDNGAEFTTIPKGAIVFNHKQTEELFKNGKVTSGGGRAKAFAGGTAFAQGTAFSSGSGGGIGKVIGKTIKKVVKEVVEKTKKSENTNKSNKSNKSASSTSSSSGGSNSSGGSGGGTSKVEGSAVGKDEKDKFEETFDWIEVAIERIEREIDNLDKTANNVYKSWTSRNLALFKEIDEVGKLIDTQKSAYDAYMAEANKVGLNESWAKKVREGSLSIEDETTISESTAEKIKEYQEWYNKALEAKDAIEDLREEESKLYQQRFENAQTRYESILQGYEHTESMLNEYISQAEAKGHIVSKNYYQALIDNEKDNISVLKTEQAALIKARDEAVASNKIVKGSQAWYDMCSEIDSVTQAIEEGETALIEYGNSMRDIDWQVFDLIQERISDITAEADFLIELMSNDKLFDDNGKLTDKGMATIGLHAQNVNTYMYKADDYGKEVAEIDRKIASGEYDQYDGNVIAKRKEYLELQREAILNAEQEKQSIKSLLEDAYSQELDYLQEKIDKTNEAIDSQKDLYDYQKQVKEQSEEIAALEKQRASYLNDGSEESKAKLQEITVSLKEAKENLQETEYDRYISDQSALLDSLYEEYELILNQRLDNVDALLSDMITEINTNATTISTTLSTEASNVGTTLSDAMKNIWSGEGEAKSVIAEYGSGFQKEQTATNTTLNGIKTDVNAMVDDVDKDAQKKIEAPKTPPSTKADPTGNAKPPKKKEPKKEEKPKITDDTLMGIAAAIWCLEGKGGWGADPF